MTGSKVVWPTRTDNPREVEAFRNAQNDDNFEKANQIPGMADGNLFESLNGDLADSGLVADLLLMVGDVLGTAKQIIVTDNGNGTITLSTPQNIDTDADVTFDTLTIDKAIFTLTSGETAAEGQLAWNNDDGTLNLGLPGGNVVLQIGQETLAPRSKASGSDILNGQLVYVSGASGSNPHMSLAKADSPITASGTIAMATENVSENQLGYYNAFGLVRDINTAAYTEGEQLYLSPTVSGGYTNIKPVPPYLIIKIGVVIRSHATEGSIFVSISQRTNNFNHIRGMIANSVPHADSNGFLTETNPGLTFDGTDLSLRADNARLDFGAGIDTSLTFTGSAFRIKTNHTADSDLLIKCGSTKTIRLLDSVYEDLQVSISNVRIPPANAPTERFYNHGIGGGVTFPVLGFGTGEYIYFDLQTSHTMKLNTVLDNHIHYMTPTDGSATPDRFNFQLDVIAATIGGNWAVPTGSPFTTETIIGGDYTNSHELAEIAEIPAVNTTISTVYKCKLTRIAASQDEYAGEVYLQFTDCHYQKDTMGSRLEDAK